MNAERVRCWAGARAASSVSPVWWRQVARPRPLLPSPSTQCASSSCRRSLHSGSVRTTPPPILSRPPRVGDKVYLAMSGGVDSSVAALLALEAGLEPIAAVFMRNWSTLDETGQAQPGSGGAMGCEWQQDWDFVQRTAAKLGGLETRLIDLSQDYWTSVFSPALDSWGSGNTPNPDVACNREIKFGSLMDRLMPELASSDSNPSPFSREATKTWLVTGHYAGMRWTPVSRTGDATLYHPSLIRAKDRNKDQTYFLSSVGASRLSHAHFPLENLLKTEVRQLARRYDLPAAEKAESMGLCFVGERRGGVQPGSRAESKPQPQRGGFGAFLADYIDAVPGIIEDLSGNRLATHKGLHTLTVGQGARIAGQAKKWFVASKDARRNVVIVVQGADHPALLCTSLEAGRIDWIDGAPPAELVDPDGKDEVELLAQVRHRQLEVPCVVRRARRRDSSSSSSSTGFQVSFPTPAHSVAAGQVVALYDGDRCLGSGVIDSVTTLHDEQRRSADATTRLSTLPHGEIRTESVQV